MDLEDARDIICAVGNKTGFEKDWGAIADVALCCGGDFLSKPRFLTPRIFFIERLNIDIYTDARAPWRRRGNG